ncbi:hypothetical protein Q4566_02780 [Tamlana sp. 2_MG-2023]|nr:MULTISPECIES: hypothetical protein [unclassified Tamlana]MDO6759113.1 hypothetical protein [Tamlana sp. 2_MG-2023]MDO6789812.1 hypothetical protein [Tamlana sp. 1_MG-2023]
MDNKANEAEKEVVIFMSIDHLKKGNYELKILLNNEVVKSVKITK